MNADGQFRYNLLISSNLYLPEHFRQRYKKRVSKRSVRMMDSTKNAYRLGKDIKLLENSAVRRSLEKAQHGRTCKIYKGFVWWFDRNVAITVYPISGLEKNNKRSYK